MYYDTYSCKIQEIDTFQKKESYEIEGSDRARISKYCPDGNLICFLYKDAKTLIEMMERGCRISENGNCVGWRSSKSEYSWMNYKEFMKKSRNFGSGLINLGVKPGQSTTIGIYAKNSVQWLMAQYGCFYQSMLIVPLYDTLGPDACTFMINHGETRVIICDKEIKAKSILLRKNETPHLKHIIVIDNISEEIKQLSKEKGIKLHHFKDIEELGRRNPIPSKLPIPSNDAIICYTSGTTGDPKGVVLTHTNIMAAVYGVLIQMDDIKFDKKDVMISYLPLAHIMEQMCECCVFLHGGSVGFYDGDVTKLTDDMQILRPTFFPAVPRLLNKLYDQAQVQVNIGKKKLQIPLQIDKTCLNMSKFEEISEYDSTLYKSFYNSLGGKLRLILTGAAPITEKVLMFYHQTLKCEVIEVYGQTECAGPCTANVVKPNSLGNVGPPFACVMIKLEEVPDLGYIKESNTGEVCVKGYSVFERYFKDPQKTAETLDKDGWLHTGDIATWLPNGTLKIIDRKKHIFKLSQGEYVSPEKIENIYLQSQYISQILVYGDSLQSYLVAIVIPDKDVIIPWCKENSRSEKWEKIVKDPVIKQLIFNDMKRIAKSSGLISFEQVKEMHLHPDSLTFEGGQLTPTMKTKRIICRNQFMKVIQAMYNNKDY